MKTNRGATASVQSLRGFNLNQGEGNNTMIENAIERTIDGAAGAYLSRALPTILWAGLIAGTLDITAAFSNTVWQGGRPVRVLQSIAGGLLGRDSYQGGWKTAALGFILHFFIATTWAAVYYAASLKLSLLTRQAVWCGLLFGVMVYLVMYALVLPLSALQFRFFNQAATAIFTSVLIHLFCVGLPIALIVRWRAQ